MMSLFRGFGQVLIVLVSVMVPLVIGFVWFAENLPPPTNEPMMTDAIVVLTGGSDRLSTGIALLAAGKGKRLFVSGVHQGVDVPELLRIAHASPAPGMTLVDLASRIDVGHEAGDTFGNAVETDAWMKTHHFETLRLVTADYHMRRAIIEFQMYAPDVQVLPNPVQPQATGTGRWWRDKATRDLLLSEYGKYVIARWRYTLSRVLDKA